MGKFSAFSSPFPQYTHDVVGVAPFLPSPLIPSTYTPCDPPTPLSFPAFLEATVKIYSDGRVPQLFYNLSLSLSLSRICVVILGRTGRRRTERRTDGQTDGLGSFFLFVRSAGHSGGDGDGRGRSLTDHGGGDAGGGGGGGGGTYKKEEGGQRNFVQIAIHANFFSSVWRLIQDLLSNAAPL